MSNFINDYNNLRNADFNTANIVELFAENKDVSDLNNITSNIGKTILALDKDISARLQQHEVNQLVNLHENLKTLSSNINSYITNRNWKQRFQDIFAWRFNTLYKLQKNLPQILETIQKREGVPAELKNNEIQAHEKARDRALTKLTEAHEAQTKKLKEQAKKLTEAQEAQTKKIKEKAKKKKEKISYRLDAIVFVQDKIKTTVQKRIGEINEENPQTTTIIRKSLKSYGIACFSALHAEK